METGRICNMAIMDLFLILFFLGTTYVCQGMAELSC